MQPVSHGQQPLPGAGTWDGSLASVPDVTKALLALAEHQRQLDSEIFAQDWYIDELRRPLPAGTDVGLARLGHGLALLEASLEAREAALDEAARAPRVQSLSWVARGADDTCAWTLPADVAVETLSIEIENRGATDLADPHLAINGHGAWTDLASIARAAVGDERAPAQQARLLWEFISRELDHGEPPDARGPRVTRDPVQLMNSYGYGLCGDVAWLYHDLARELGLEARVWYLGGHTVPEVRIDERYQHFDPDAGLAYLLHGSDQAASIEDLVRDPSLFANVIHAPDRDPTETERLRRVLPPRYTSAEDNRTFTVDDAAVTSQPLRWSLRPGESLRRDQHPLGRRFRCDRLPRPPSYANGLWRYEHPGAEPGEALALPFESPYPLVEGRLLVDIADPTDYDDWVITVRLPTGEQVELPWVPDRRGGVATLNGVLANGFGAPDHALTIEVAPRDPQTSGQIVRVRCEFIVQVAPRSLPRLSPGVNSVRWSCASDDAQARITVRYLLTD